jgi:Glycogen recognition site of AMP-activated protein kinase/Domain of unknown function (DUF3471)
MKPSSIIEGSLLFTLCFVWAQTPVCPRGDPNHRDSEEWQQTSPKVSSEALKKYAGRYELEPGIIPISTLDVSLENNELWIKPSLVKKRRLLHKSKTVFVDEVEGTRYTFDRDEEGKIVSLTFAYEGADYTARRVVLPPPSLKGNTTFRLKGYAEASIVILAGSFNNWNQSQFVFGREGDEWICRIDLEPGTHAYKFIVDGNWILDPANPNTEDDDYGVKNSVVLVTRSSNPKP